jgi:hypothetical protein
MFLLRLLLKNAFRHRLRTLLTMVGLVVAICAFGLLRTIVDAWYAGVEGSSSTRLITRSATSLTLPLPLSYAERLRAVDGVTGVSWSNWFGGIYITERNFFPQFAVDPATYLPLYPEFVLPTTSAWPGCATARAWWWGASWPTSSAGRWATRSRCAAPSTPAPGPSRCAASTTAPTPGPTRTRC